MPDPRFESKPVVAYRTTSAERQIGVGRPPMDPMGRAAIGQPISINEGIDECQFDF